jgi:hypothetical protein
LARDRQPQISAGVEIVAVLDFILLIETRKYLFYRKWREISTAKIFPNFAGRKSEAKSRRS